LLFDPGYLALTALALKCEAAMSCIDQEAPGMLKFDAEPALSKRGTANFARTVFSMKRAEP
jgi:hypothetical protein